MVTLIAVLSGGFFLLVAYAILKVFSGRSAGEPKIDHAVLAEAERALRETSAQDWVVLKRCHGPAYSHAAMTEIVSALNTEGVMGTYDVVASSSADGGVTNFMLKVLAGDETRALEILARLEKS